MGSVLSGRYRIDALVATGAFGAVYRGVHLNMRKQIAIKVLHPEIENFPELVQRFEREAVAGAHISHPNVALSIDLGTFDSNRKPARSTLPPRPSRNSYFLVQELVRGETLRQTLERGRLPPARAARIARQVAAGLGAAHEKGIVHRDLKPRNVMLVNGTDDLVKVIDFGFARVPSDLPDTDDELGAPKWRKSDANIVFGSVAYLAPELAFGMRNATERSDLYSLGLILYEMLVGQHPFDITLPPADLFACHSTLLPPRFAEIDQEHQVHEALETIVRRLLEKQPANRFGAQELIRALDEAMGDDHIYQAWPYLQTMRPPPASERPKPHPAGSSIRGERSSSRRNWPLGGLVFALSLGLTGIAGALKRPTPTTFAAAVSAPDQAPTMAVTTPSTASAAADGSLDRTKRQFTELASLGNTDEASDALLALIRVDATALADPTVQNAVVTLLARLSGGDASTDKVFNALSYKGGALGFDVMYMVFERFPSSYAARRAEDTLRQAFDRLSPALQVTWGLRTTVCEDKDKESLFERAGEMGDERTLALLVMMQDTRCRRIRGQCCLPGSRALANAIARLQSKRRE